MPACSKMDPLVAKAEPISDSSSTSWITYLRKGKKTLVWQQPEREVRICKKSSPADAKVSEEGGGRGASGTGAEVPLQSMKVNSGADIDLQPVEDPMSEQVDA
ncbi:protein pxr1-like [Limosa lapponica baueri]|uniref:Protein pxr1-like n=1 Tax=Limosa lapponica baueri TaxID=1758121 RepID=A0A2I0UB95_LIMLA|nr:protein pxr1-like [Limosa lapponica baueri]